MGFLLDIDQQILIFLNGLGTPFWDGFWLFITNQINWTPFFILLIYFLYRVLPCQIFFIALVVVVFMVAFSDQFTNFIRIIFKRLRPINDPAINSFLRTLIRPQSYSFTSGHATTSMALMVYVVLLLKNYYKKYLLFSFFSFPFLFTYSRLYLGVHYPSDIFCGFLVGTIIGWLFHKIFKVVCKRLKFKTSKPHQA